MTDPKSHAQQLEFFEIPSPCIGVCESGPRGFCKGCFRSRDERLYWLKVDDATKRKIISACVRRKKAVLARKRKAQVEQGEVGEQQYPLFDSPPEII
ncbi:DUF1289 domain-containing protein [Alteromonas sp. IB21]|uniref:DUF1289 domain-containing protein n=1 Tax=Alteromonas sp. IB21 TaxID=2779369 RepID=UPI0018E857B4|nr:DUF1289 domain-containing protein [Alteromonas sp. IB21]MBJ2127714.1 DUF1289 domain-containing protein [Alteromonas sp. IB21]|tara:strand:- start:4789 stop:5079 length:291 start_codon:yes stop_codon:yes gene_type:complete